MTDTGPPRHDPYAALRHRDFSLYLVASMIGTIGSKMQSLAVGWELYQRTHSELALGLVGLAQILPFLTLILPAGHLADRTSRRRILVATETGHLLVALGLALVSLTRAPVALMYALLAGAGMANAFATPARWAFVPQLVPLEDLPNAITWRTSGWQLATVLGPALAGLGFYVGLFPSHLYLIHAGASLVVVSVFGILAPRPRPFATEPLSWSTLLAGIHFVGRRPLIVAAMTLDLFAVLFGGATALLPIFAADILRVGATGLGWLEGAPAVGAMGMALLLAHRPPMKRAGRALLGAVVGFGLATIVFGLSRSFALSVAMLFLTGAFDMISVVIRSTLVQLLTPDSMRGRVAAVNAVFVSMSNELGSFESGALAWAIGPVPSVLVGGVGSLVVVFLVLHQWPNLAHLGSLADLEPETDPGLEPEPARSPSGSLPTSPTPTHQD